MRNNLLILTALFAALGVTAHTVADIKSDKSAMGKVSVDQKRGGYTGSKLRCWQYGELLFEEPGISNKTLSKDSGTIVFERGGDKTRKLVLVDIGTSTCLYEE